MQEMVIYGVSFDIVGKQPIVLLKTAEGTILAIWIGHPEAAAILMELEGASHPAAADPRPCHRDARRARRPGRPDHGHRAPREHVPRHDHGRQDGSEIEVDSRPSDAIALAVRAEAPIFAATA